ncbi:MAG: octanoyltransferase [Legionella sp.]|nr:MAG: octanoyltransferase [Legionella sp.]PJD98717.1 MAG: octanoyltransferase [Legionella sp.]
MKIQHLNMQEYNEIWMKMKEFTIHRTPETQDELWFLEHYPVYTQGQAGKAEHLLNPGAIPVIQSDRGGQVTYHGPGQIVVYTLIDITRRNMGIKTLVSGLESILIKHLARYNITAKIRCGAPGVYVEESKIASIGLRVKNGRAYHGLALNVCMDLSPFKNINPCGFSQLQMTQISEYYPNVTISEVRKHLERDFLTYFECAYP